MSATASGSNSIAVYKYARDTHLVAKYLKGSRIGLTYRTFRALSPLKRTYALPRIWISAAFRTIQISIVFIVVGKPIIELTNRSLISELRRDACQNLVYVAITQSNAIANCRFILKGSVKQSRITFIFILDIHIYFP